MVNLAVQKDNIDINYSEALQYMRVFNAFFSLKDTKYKINKHLQQRGIGDFIEGIVIDLAKQIFPNEFRERMSKKSTEDFTLVIDGTVHLIDIKTHDSNGNFCMPNMTAIDKLVKLYKEDTEKLHYLLIEYVLDNDNVLTILNVRHCKPNNISWKYLAIQNLGNGQLQIRNMRDLKIDYNLDLNDWYLSLCSEAQLFMYRQIRKFELHAKKWREAYDRGL